MIKLIMMLTLLGGCSLIKDKKPSFLLYVNQIFVDKTSKEELLNNFYYLTETKENHVILYEHKKTVVPSTWVFFDKENLVQEVVHLTGSRDLEKKIAQIQCNWVKTQYYKSFNRDDYINLLKKGRCPEKKISYGYLDKSSQYEIRWKR